MKRSDKIQPWGPEQKNENNTRNKQASKTKKQTERKNSKCQNGKNTTTVDGERRRRIWEAKEETKKVTEPTQVK